jgi:lipopolysaccharide export system protein LptA
LFAIGLLALLPTLAVAKKSDRQQPMSYVAKYTEAFNAPNTVSTLKGKVKITQGTLLLTGDMAKIHLDADTQIARVVVTGNPAHVQQLDENNNLMTGDAATIDYDNIHGIAVLTGNAVVKQHGRGEFHGDKLTYNTDTSMVTGQANGDGLVHGTFLPKPRPAEASKPATAASTPTATTGTTGTQPTPSPASQPAPPANPPVSTPAHAGSAATPQEQH